MNDRTNHGPWIFLVLLALGLLFGCTVPFGRSNAPRYAARPQPQAEPQGQMVPKQTVTYVAGPRLPHGVHTENDLDCTDCHELDDETGEPGVPTREGCLDCHEDPEEGEEPEEGEPVITGYFFDKDGKPLWKSGIQEYDPYVHFSHKAHEALEDCTVCHDNLEATEQGRPVAKLYTMAGCMECHEEQKASNECKICHESVDRTIPPRSHSRSWDEKHGYASNRLRLMELQHDCSLCHNEPSYCNDCHAETPPKSHAFRWQQRHGQAVTAAGGGMPNRCTLCHTDPNYCSDCHAVTPPQSHKHLWDQRHGQAVRAAGGDMPRSCSLCHDERSFCESCHLDEAPRNHTALFRTRTHGMMAAIDRRNCQTCHKVDFCQRCHEDTAPRSHRGMWSRRRNTHCVQCHYPITMNDRCRVCHTSNPTHPTAPAQPPGHVPGRNCRVCHNAMGGGGAPPLRHVDNGQSCEFCHK